jgi:integrase
MPRQVADQRIQTRTQRVRLTPRRKPYFRRLSDAIAIGYRRSSTLPGVWVIRRRNEDGSYTESKLRGVTPDDVIDANGLDVLSFDQACDFIRGTRAAAPEEVTLEAAATDWATAKKSGTDNPTRSRNYDYTARRITNGFPAGQTISTLTRQQVEAWRDSHLVDGAAADTQRKRRATANRELATLKAILNRAADDIDATMPRPWDRVGKFEAGQSFGKRVIVLTPDERKALIEACASPALRDLVVAGLNTGCRYGELITARVRDLNGRRLTVSGKTGTRTIVLSPAAEAHLSGLVAGVNDPNRTILVRDNGIPWTDGDQIGPFATAVKHAGLDPAATFYCLRHSYITEHLTAGVPVTALADQCGTSGLMIEKTYANFLGSDLERWFAISVAS